MLSLLVLLIHPITFIFLSIFLFFAALERYGLFSSTTIRSLSIVFSICLLGAMFWPFLSYRTLLFPGALSADPNGLVMYQSVFRQTWPVLIFGVPLLINRLRARPRDLLSLSAAAFLVIYLFGYWAQIWNFGRVISFFCLTTQIAVADWLTRAMSIAPSRALSTSVCRAVHATKLMPIFLFLFLFAQFSLARFYQTTAFSPYARYSFTKALIKPGSLVLSDLRTSRYFPSFGEKVVVFDSPPFFKHSFLEREKDLAAFFGSVGSNDREDILRKYKPDYIFVDIRQLPSWDRNEKEILGLGVLVHKEGEMYLINCETMWDDKNVGSLQ